MQGQPYKWEPCARLLVGWDSDTADPMCARPAGHPGMCSSTRPHFYRFGGEWWISWNGRGSHQRSITLNDYPVGSTLPGARA